MQPVIETRAIPHIGIAVAPVQKRGLIVQTVDSRIGDGNRADRVVGIVALWRE